MQRLKYLLLFILLLTMACLQNPEPLIDVYDLYFRSDRDGPFDIYRMNSNGGELTRITQSEGIAKFKFTADGSVIFYQKTSGGTYDIYKMNSNGTGEQQLTNLSAERISWDVSPDGKKIVYTMYSSRLFILDTETTQMDTITAIYNGFQVTWYYGYFLWQGDKIVCRATDRAIKVVDLNTNSVRHLCWNCIDMDYNWQVFPNEDKVLYQDDHVTFILDINNSWRQYIPIAAGSPQLTPDGNGIIYGPMYGVEGDIILYNFNSEEKRFIKTINSDQFDSSISSFSFSPDGNLVIWNSGRRSGNSPVIEDIFRMDIHGYNFRQLTATSATDRDPVFMPSIN